MVKRRGPKGGMGSILRDAYDHLMEPDDCEPILEAVHRDRRAHPDHPPRAIDSGDLGDLCGQPPDDA